MSEQAVDLKHADLIARVAALEDQLAAHQRQLVNTVAEQIQHLFTNQVMVDSLAHRFLIAGANAIAHKVSSSTERAPELTVVEGYIPGALRAILNEDGSITVDQQLKGATSAGGEWESATVQFEEKGILESFAQLMAAFGATAGRVYYITDTVTRDTHRTKLARDLASDVGAVEDEDKLDTYPEGEDPKDDDGSFKSVEVESPTHVIMLLVPMGFGGVPSDSLGVASTMGLDETVELIRAGQTLHTTADQVEINDVLCIARDGAVMKECVTSLHYISRLDKDADPVEA